MNNSLKEQLDSSHVIYTLISEHEKIIDLLNELDVNNIEFKTEKFKSYQDVADKVRMITLLITQLTDSVESHHYREEKILFPEISRFRTLDDFGINIRDEHQVLLDNRQEILDLQWGINHDNFSERRQKVILLVDEIINKLRTYINLEETEIFPLALSLIDPEIWSELKEKCDSIGYCPTITPILEPYFTKISV